MASILNAAGDHELSLNEELAIQEANQIMAKRNEMKNSNNSPKKPPPKSAKK